jgi:dTDP-4-dehydrorhamnose reductase
MRCLITGLGGSLAPHLAQAMQKLGHEVLAWRKEQTSPEDPAQVARWLEEHQPQAMAHLALGPVAWAAQLAGYAAQHQLPFVLTSTAMVFDHLPNGPHQPADARTAHDDYGRYKIACEDAVQAANPQASVLRIGWQIDATQAGNNMLMALDGWQNERQQVAASRLWIPACSFMPDTAQAIVSLLLSPQAQHRGLLHFDSNAHDALPFDVLVAKLKAAFQREHWQVVSTEDYAHDQRLVGGPLTAPPLLQRLRAYETSTGAVPADEA